MKKVYIRGALGLLLGLALFASAGAAQAASLTGNQVQAIISLLQSFGADQGTVNNVYAALMGNPGQPGGGRCPALSYNLYYGLGDAQTSGQVSQLQQFLGVYPVTGYFGSMTRSAVAQYQQRYGVYPVTGGVGPLTRGAIARNCNGGGVTAAPQISQLSPAQGPVGTTIAIYGSGFTQDNTVRFASGGTQHVGSSNNGTLIYYTIPQQVGPCDLVTQGQPVCAAALMLVQPGTYSISVSNANGQSNAYTFTVTQATVGGVTVTSPSAGQAYVRGQDMTITWGYPVTPNSTNMALDLYTVAGAKVGTIAISNQTSGTYMWHIPGYPQNYMCTMQYPNGLCGTNIPTGSYYLKVSAIGTGMDPNVTPIASGQSGVFTISLQ